MTTISPLRATALTHNVLLKQLISKGRLIGISIIALLPMLLGWVIGRRSTNPLEAGVGFVSYMGLSILIPVVALIFASASLGDTREDGTLVYLWLRPIPRWSVTGGAWMASVTAALPLTVIPMAVAAILLDAGNTLITATILTSILAVCAYCGIFLLLGLLVKNPVLWGLAYIFIWEATIASFAKPAAALAVSGYSRAIMAGKTGVEFDYLWSPSQGTSIFMLIVIVVVAIGLSTIRLNRLEVP
ncbi:MAG: ABC transporter permease subunit [Acidimicrobiales bacterium]|nr:ABC transporter permease subunit [Acidimicrobiales bacterium]